MTDELDRLVRSLEAERARPRRSWQVTPDHAEPSTRRYADCPECGTHVALTLRGRIWRHHRRDQLGAYCPGSGQQPKGNP
jgi:hypothetical protein